MDNPSLYSNSGEGLLEIFELRVIVLYTPYGGEYWVGKIRWNGRYSDLTMLLAMRQNLEEASFQGYSVTHWNMWILVFAHTMAAHVACASQLGS